eukprot:Clim_evm7s168 gene=Clim_evmTU7s168
MSLFRSLLQVRSSMTPRVRSGLLYRPFAAYATEGPTTTQVPPTLTADGTANEGSTTNGRSVGRRKSKNLRINPNNPNFRRGPPKPMNKDAPHEVQSALNILKDETRGRVRKSSGRDKIDMSAAAGQHDGLAQFFFFKSEKAGQHGRAWTVPELRNKTYQELHCLWWECLKERNRHMTMSLGVDYSNTGGEDRAQNRWAGQSRLPEVNRTLSNIKYVLGEREWMRRAVELMDDDQIREVIETNGAGLNFGLSPESLPPSGKDSIVDMAEAVEEYLDNGPIEVPKPAEKKRGFRSGTGFEEASKSMDSIGLRPPTK